MPRLPASAVLGAALLLAASAYPQQVEKKPADASAASTAPAAPDYSQEPFVIEQYHVRARFENDGTGRRETLVRFRVQSEAGVQQLGQLVFGYNSSNERMEIGSVEVRKSDGTTISAPPDAVQDMTGPVAREAPMYTDLRQKHVTVPGLRPGETLTYHVTAQLHTPLAPGQFWLEHDFLKDAIVLDETLEVNVPRDRAVKLKTHPGTDPTVTEENDRKIYRWKSSRLKREEEGQEEAKPRKKPPKKPEGPAVQLTTFQSWEEVGGWYAGLERERATPTDLVRAKAQELVRGRASDIERIEALYEFVASNFRYVSLSFGLGRYQPHAAADVLANQYGDCKDKHTLLEALAEAIGLRAYPVLIHSRRKIDPEIPSPAQFDHVITAVPLGKDWIWLDTTTEVAPFRLLSSNLRRKQALLIPLAAPPTAAKVAADEAARLVETPADLPFPATQRVDVDAQVSELGKLSAQVRYTLRGDTELLLRLGFRRTPQSQWKQLGQLLAVSDGFRGEVSEVKTSDPAATREPFHVEYRIAQPNYLDWSTKKSQLALPLPAVGLPEASGGDDEADTEPLDLGTPLEITTRVVMELPVKYAARAPVAVAVIRDYAEYRSSYKVEGNKITAERVLRFKVREIPAARTRDYQAFTRAIRADEQQEFALEGTRAAGPKIPEGVKADELYEAGVAAYNKGSFQTAIDLLKRVVEMEPKHRSAWNNLGQAYLSLHQLDDALQAFRKQIEANPYDEYAYNNMGLALWQQQKYDEASEAFHKQIEVNPLDRWAHANLGLLYRDTHRYADAVPELEKAVSLTPEDPALHLGLGEAYLQLGQEEKALTAFDKALEIAPAPPVWNDIAYQFALKKVHLDRAQQYAESAVATTAAQLRNLALDRLTPNELAHVVGLAGYWDTLGWVHFQKGEIDAAERYVRASWLLGQRGEVGDHLAQIYERRGRKADAIRTYAQALAATRPVPETRGRLAQLVGGDEKVPPLRARAAMELSAMRTLDPGALLLETMTGEFFVLLAPGPPDASGITAKVEGVRFASGSEKLRQFEGALRALHFPDIFPDDTPTKIVRRGILSCSTATRGCVFVLITPDLVTSID